MQEPNLYRFMNILSSSNPYSGLNLALQICPPDTCIGSLPISSNERFLITENLREQVVAFDFRKRPPRSDSCCSSESNISSPASHGFHHQDILRASTDLCLANPTRDSNVSRKAGCLGNSTEDWVNEVNSFKVGGQEQVEESVAQGRAPLVYVHSTAFDPFFEDLQIMGDPKHSAALTYQSRSSFDHWSEMYATYTGYGQGGILSDRLVTETDLRLQPYAFPLGPQPTSSSRVYQGFSNQSFVRSVEPGLHGEVMSRGGPSRLQSNHLFTRDPAIPDSCLRNGQRRFLGSRSIALTKTFPHCGNRAAGQQYDITANMSLRSRHSSRLPSKRSARAPRMRWTSSLHAHFVHAVELLGGHERMPSKVNLTAPRLDVVLQIRD